MNKESVKLTHKDFRQQVVDLARLCGWKCAFTWTSIHSPAGFPDLVLARPPRVLFAELKSEKREPTEAQAEWLDILRACPGVEVYLWKPPDFDHIVQILRRAEGSG